MKSGNAITSRDSQEVRHFAAVRQALLEDRKRLVPGDRLEVGGAALGARTALEGTGEAGRGILLHDP